MKRHRDRKTERQRHRVIQLDEQKQIKKRDKERDRQRERETERATWRQRDNDNCFTYNGCNCAFLQKDILKH